MCKTFLLQAKLLLERVRQSDSPQATPELTTPHPLTFAVPRLGQPSHASSQAGAARPLNPVYLG